jgi:hypothetical protein
MAQQVRRRNVQAVKPKQGLAPHECLFTNSISYCKALPFPQAHEAEASATSPPERSQEPCRLPWRLPTIRKNPGPGDDQAWRCGARAQRGEAKAKRPR